MIGRSDLPVDADPQRRFLPCLVAFMVYLAVLAVSGVLLLDGYAQRWETQLKGTLTVEIAATEDSETDARYLQKSLDILRTTPGVAHVEEISAERVAELLVPWLGDEKLVGELPIPQLIDLTIASDWAFNREALERRLTAAVPGANVVDHGPWLQPILDMIRTAETLATIILALIVLVTAATVVYATRSGLAMHRDVISVLHLIGAHDSYVARQFADRALSLGLWGGLAGLIFALATLFGLYIIATGSVDAVDVLAPARALAPGHWAIISITPVVVAGIAMVTARVTVMRTLKRLL